MRGSKHVPEPGPGEATVSCATICGSDLHTCLGRRRSPAPSVLGHEMVGEVAAMYGAGVLDFHGSPLAIGDRVTWSMVWSCGACYYCGKGLRPKCERLRKFGHEELAPGRELFGGYAEYCHLPSGTAIFRVPRAVSDYAASPSNCATATVAAVLRNAGAVDDATVLIFGAGMLGLTACAMAKAAGARRVIAIERDDSRRALAPRFGATLSLESEVPDAYRNVLDLTEGRGADLALEFAGTPETAESATRLLRAGGHLVMAGAVFPSRPLALPAEQIVRRMLRLTGVYNYQPEDLDRGLQFLAASRSDFPFDDLIGASFPLEDINAAIAFAERERPPRTAIIPF